METTNLLLLTAAKNIVGLDEDECGVASISRQGRAIEDKEDEDLDEEKVEEHEELV